MIQLIVPSSSLPLFLQKRCLAYCGFHTLVITFDNMNHKAPGKWDQSLYLLYTLWVYISCCNLQPEKLGSVWYLVLSVCLRLSLLFASSSFSPHTLNSWPQYVTDCAAFLPRLPLSRQRWVLCHLLHDTEAALRQVASHNLSVLSPVSHTHIYTLTCKLTQNNCVNHLSKNVLYNR